MSSCTVHSFSSGRSHISSALLYMKVPPHVKVDKILCRKKAAVRGQIMTVWHIEKEKKNLQKEDFEWF